MTNQPKLLAHFMLRSRRVVFTTAVEYGGQIRRIGDEITVPVHVADALIGAGMASLYPLPRTPLESAPRIDSSGVTPRPRGRPRKTPHGDSQ